MHKQADPGKRPKSGVPEWALSDSMCKAVILERVARYAKHCGVKVVTGEPRESMAAMVAAARERYAEYTERSNGERWRKHLSYDGSLYAGRQARLIFLAYRLRYNAVQVSQELGDTTPVHIHQNL